MVSSSSLILSINLSTSGSKTPCLNTWGSTLGAMSCAGSSCEDSADTKASLARPLSPSSEMSFPDAEPVLLSLNTFIEPLLLNTVRKSLKSPDSRLSSLFSEFTSVYLYFVMPVSLIILSKRSAFSRMLDILSSSYHNLAAHVGTSHGYCHRLFLAAEAAGYPFHLA